MEKRQDLFGEHRRVWHLVVAFPFDASPDAVCLGGAAGGIAGGLAVVWAVIRKAGSG